MSSVFELTEDEREAMRAHRDERDRIALELGVSLLRFIARARDAEQRIVDLEREEEALAAGLIKKYGIDPERQVRFDYDAGTLVEE